MDERWAVDGVNYWENEDCPREYLERAFINLIDFVEGIEIDADKLADVSDKELRKEIGFYEYLSEK